MRTKAYNRENAVIYAKKWALARNPEYYDFDGLGGDCTNFASQCLYAGCKIMNNTKDTGWYYLSLNNRSAAWSGVEYLHRFLMSENRLGPVGREVGENELDFGDLIFLSNGTNLYHTLVVCGFSNAVPLVCCHTIDSFMRPLSSYIYSESIPVHIEKINIY